MASTAEIIPFRAPSIKELVFDLQASKLTTQALYARADPLTDGEHAAIDESEALSHRLEQQLLAALRNATGVTWSQLSEVLS